MTDFAQRCAGEPPEVTLGAGASVMEWLLMPRLPALRQALRCSQFKLIRERSELLAERLRDSRLDVAIIREDAVICPLRVETSMAFGYALYVPRALAGPPRTLHRWRPTVPMIAPSQGWTRDRVDSAVAAAGLTLRIEIEGVSTTLAARALRDGRYAAILPELATAELAQADVIVLRPAFLRTIERRLVIAWRPRQAETRPVIAQAVEAIKQLLTVNPTPLRSGTGPRSSSLGTGSTLETLSASSFKSRPEWRLLKGQRVALRAAFWLAFDTYALQPSVRKTGLPRQTGACRPSVSDGDPIRARSAHFRLK